MAAFNDFDLDVTAKQSSDVDATPQITSISLCTPGCKTGVLMGCNLQTASCNCQIVVSK